MVLLDLDNTINKYLEIINDNILEPYLIEKEYVTPHAKDIEGITNTWFFTANNSKVKVDTDTSLITKYTAATETAANLKIKQVVNTKYAYITNTINAAVSSSTMIKDENLFDKIKIDSDGFIYYNGSTKIYDLTIFSSTVLNNIEEEDSTVTNDTYYDYFVRFKILKYIKENHMNTKTATLKTDIIAKIKNNNIIVEKGVTTPVSNIKIDKMLDLLHFINKNKFDKFEAIVNCLYYYYWMALNEYNTIYCSRQLTYFKYTSFKTGGDALKAITKLSGADGFGTEADATSPVRKIEKVLITIFEILCKTVSDNKYENIIKNIFDNNTNTKIFINALLELYGMNSGNNNQLYFAEYVSSATPITKTLLLSDDAVTENLTVKLTTLTPGTNINTIANYNEHFLLLDKIKNGSAVYFNFKANSNIKYNSILFKLNNAITTNFNDIITSKITLEPYINKIKNLYNLIKETPQFINKLDSDNKFIDATPGDFVTTDIDRQLTSIKGDLKIIIEHYEKAVELNKIKTKLDDIPNMIKETVDKFDKTKDVIPLNEFKKNIKESDSIYKDNIDKYKIKNNQLNNIVKSNLYNNIFLYVTIIILILICLGIIYINNHKTALKTQYSIMVITFLLFYYIIYTNVTINVTEDFTTTPQTVTEIYSHVQKYLLALASSDKEYKVFLEKEKDKYADYAKSSKSKVNNLETVLNDEFINAIKSKELVKFLILFTAICIVCFIVQTNVEDLTTTSIIFIILFIIILAIYFYNINLMTRTKHDNKYWNHRMTMK